MGRRNSRPEPQSAGFTLIESVLVLVFAGFVMILAMTVLMAAPRSIAQSLAAERDALAVDSCLARLEALARANRADGNALAAVVAGGLDGNVAGTDVGVTFEWQGFVVRGKADAEGTNASLETVKAEDHVLLQVTAKRGDAEVSRAWAN